MPRRKIPTKAELIQLQKLYKTDEKIAERLGNATPQLVAYWRRKKNIPRHSFPKFSEAEIKELWERYGDDYRCGLELGISKAAFYNWRRRYGLKHKPAFLKLEQLELNLGSPGKAAARKHNYGHRTISQKILAESSRQNRVEEGQIVEVEPDLAVSHNNAGIIIEKFLKYGISYVWNPNRIIIPLNHGGLPQSVETAELHKEIRDFAKKQHIKGFYDICEGAGNQIMIEKAHVLPGQLALGSEKYVVSSGCIGAFGTSIDNNEMAALWASGKIWLRVPETMKILVNGKMHRGIFAKDVILFIAGKLNNNCADYKAIEFYGSSISHMSISERFTLANLATELGAKAAICPFDSVTRRYFHNQTKMPYRPALADKDAGYCETYEFNIDHLPPQIACPHGLDKVTSVAEVAGIPINQIIIGSCNNGRFDDLRVVADILKGKRISSEVRVMIYPGSRAVYLEALKKGIIRAFMEAGAIVMNPGCGPCHNGYHGLLASGERCLSTTNHNNQGAMGSPDSEIYLVSPATAAASAIKGVITDPTPYL